MIEAPLLLIVDDEPLVRFSLRAYLEDVGYRCIEAADGVEGLEAFKRMGPDLVLTDLRMPRLDGFGFLKALKELSPTTPVVVITGAGDATAAQKAVEMGASLCLFKPLYNMTVLTTALLPLVRATPP